MLGREFALAELSPVLRFPAAQAIGFHFIDYLVHGWDVARSLGLAYEPEADVLAAALPVAQAVPGGSARTRDGAPFAPGRPVPAQAGLLDQIVAMLGRSPAWPELRPGGGYRRAMRAEQADVVIIGAGLAGSAAARALAIRGRSVVLLEAFQPGHRRGSSHGSARIFRRAYADPLYVRLTGQAQVLWRQLADEAGEEFVAPVGAVDFGPSRLQEKMHEIMTGLGVPAELMPAEAAAERWPGISFGPEPVMFHPDGGVIDPERAMAAMRAIAAAHGAQVCYGAPVLRVEAAADGATVHTADRSWRAPTVVVAAGAWLEPLLGGQVPLPPLVVTQVGAFHFASRTPQPWPAFIWYGDMVRYGLPAGRDGEVPGAIKVGEHGGGASTTGDSRDGVVNPAARDRVREFAGQLLPGLEPEPVGEVTCLYTSTPNEDFILDRHGPFVVCSPCSGHGAKFAPLTGEIVADLACGGTSPERRFTLAAHVG